MVNLLVIVSFFASCDGGFWQNIGIQELSFLHLVALTEDIVKLLVIVSFFASCDGGFWQNLGIHKLFFLHPVATGAKRSLNSTDANVAPKNWHQNA